MPSPGFPHAVLFDHDGTLVDTEPLWDRAKQNLAAEHGRLWTPEDSLATLGRPVAATIELRGDQLVVTTDEPLSGVAPGQAVVCYDGTRVVGSATIAVARPALVS